MPWWYEIIKAAKFLNISPRELAPGVPVCLWVEWALIVQAADANVETWFRAKAFHDMRFQQLMSGARK